MKRLHLSREAQDDLRGIWLYSAENWGPQQANGYVNAIRTAIMGLPDGRTPSRSAKDVLPGCRSLTCGKHIVFFRENDDAIAVIRVLHQRMDAGRWV